MQPAYQVDGGLGVVSSLHVDADEGVGLDGMLDEGCYRGFGERGVEVETHLGQFDANVRIEAAPGNGVEQAMVNVGCLLDFLRGMNIFAQAVERDGEALLVDGGGRRQRVLYTRAGDEARRHAPAQRPIFSKFA